MNREPSVYVAMSCGLDPEQLRGAVRLLKHCNPSKQRLAAVAMRDPGLEDDDIAEMFFESPAWARRVREQIEHLRESEPIPLHLEYLDDGLSPDDPSPSEILDRAAAIRSQRPDSEKESRIKPLSLHVTRGPATEVQRRFAWGS